MRQKLRKYIKDFDEDMAKFRENPDANDDEEAAEKAESDAEDESKDEDSSAPVTKSDFKKKSKSTTPADGDDEDDSDDSYWDSDSDEESSSSSEEDTKYASLRERFLKKTSDKDDDKKEKKAKDKAAKKKEKKLMEEDEDDDEEDGWIKVDGGGADKPKMFEKDAEINHELVRLLLFSRIFHKNFNFLYLLKIIEKFVKLCLHSCNTIRNSFHFHEFLIEIWKLPIFVRRS